MRQHNTNDNQIYLEVELSEIKKLIDQEFKYLDLNASYSQAFEVIQNKINDFLLKKIDRQHVHGKTNIVSTVWHHVENIEEIIEFYHEYFEEKHTNSPSFNDSQMN